jgi:hypothetical protein
MQDDTASTLPENPPPDPDPSSAAEPPNLAPATEGPSNLVLPQGVLTVPIPDLESWQPDLDLPPASPAVFPRDFLRRPVLVPTARRIAGGLPPGATKGLQPTKLSTKLTAEQAADPVIREKLRQLAIDQLIEDICQQLSVPPDRIEIISIEQWDVPTEGGFIHWIRITYRITIYGRDALINVADFPVLI